MPPLSPVGPARLRAEARKQKKKQQRLQKAAARQAAAAAFDAARNRGARLERLAQALSTNEHVSRDLAPWAQVAAGIQHLPPADRAAAAAFVVDVEARVPGLALVPVDDHRSLGLAIVQLGRIQDAFARPLATFAPRTRSRRGQWDALVAHLCFRYPAPLFLEACFLEGGLCDGARRLAPRIGCGASWRDHQLPLTLTKKAAHALSTSTQRSASLTQTVRQAQATTLGVTAAQWAALAPFARPLHAGDDDFVCAFYDFVARHAVVDDLALIAAEVGRARIAGVEVGLKGRTPTSLSRWARAQRRERELREKGRFDVGPLPRCVIDGGRYVLHREVDEERLSGCAPRVFTIEQITDGEALVAEGLAMKHCVGTYAAAAKSGETALFSMTVGHDGTKQRRCVTVELDPQLREVAQVRGKANRRADADERAVLQAWATERGLTVAPRA